MNFMYLLVIFCTLFEHSKGFFNTALDYIKETVACSIDECCYPYSKSMPINITKLEEDISKHLYGQHLVKVALLKHFKPHIEDPNPNRALLLSFNGMPGTGKNYVSTMIANSVFKNGMRSKFVHLYSTTHNFPFESKIEEYWIQLQNNIVENVKLCPKSIFIFDEVHNMPEKLLDALKPFVDSHEVIGGVDYRKSVFILLSNSYGKNINTIVVDAYKAGRERESLTLFEMEEAMEKSLYQMKSNGLRKSQLIQNNLVTAFVPFLPLEKRHFLLCIKNYFNLNKLHFDTKIVDKILENVIFDPHDGIDLSPKGCKNIQEKVREVLP